MKYTSRYLLLFPFSFIYGIITAARNWMYDSGILNSIEFDLPIISVGNIAVGGTGKTPHVEFILNVLKPTLQVAMLSRGYKRKTKGFQLAYKNTTSEQIGDEPYQIVQKFSDVIVAVDEKRVHGVKLLRENYPLLQTVVLDDAFQHRQLKTGLSIMLTDYANLFTRDTHLPGGNLREYKKGKNRADIIVVTKCPPQLKPLEMRLIEKEINPLNYQSLFFSTYIYDELKSVFYEQNSQIISYNWLKKNNAAILLVTAIVTPKPIIDHLQSYSSDIQSLSYPDHHSFNSSDFNLILNTFEKINCTEKIILVTEKDAARIILHPHFPEKLKTITYTIPITVKILNKQENLFIKKIITYATENSRNS